MFVGHLAAAFIGKRESPSLSLGWHMAAVTLPDLLWPVFLLAGVEQVSIVPGATAFTPLVFDAYPWSHSLLMGFVWGALLAALARRRGASMRDAVVLVSLVVSHWVLDFVTHAPDMPLWPGGSPRLGLGLWHSIAGTLVVEGLLWFVALWLYLKPREARSRSGRFAFWSFVTTSTLMWIFGPWSPPPPDARSLAWFGFLGWIVVPWAAWADRHYVRRGER